MLSNHDIARWWEECWTSETEMAPWSKAVAGLTAQQAAWKPPGGHHSIWEIVLHISFWREFELRKANGEPHDEAEIARRNWSEPDEVSEAAWGGTGRGGDFGDGAVGWLAELQAQVKGGMEESEEKAQVLRCLLLHDAYHMGQIMHLRALQGLKALDSFA